MLFRSGDPAILGRRAVALLRVLLEGAGSAVSKDALIEAAWPGLAVQDSNLTVQMAALRRALEHEAQRPLRAYELLNGRRGVRVELECLMRTSHSALASSIATITSSSRPGPDRSRPPAGLGR
jgi:hypothetical protein